MVKLELLDTVAQNVYYVNCVPYERLPCKEGKNQTAEHAEDAEKTRAETRNSGYLSRFRDNLVIFSQDVFISAFFALSAVKSSLFSAES